MVSGSMRSMRLVHQSLVWTGWLKLGLPLTLNGTFLLPPSDGATSGLVPGPAYCPVKKLVVETAGALEPLKSMFHMGTSGEVRVAPGLTAMRMRDSNSSRRSQAGGLCRGAFAARRRSER